MNKGPEQSRSKQLHRIKKYALQPFMDSWKDVVGTTRADGGWRQVPSFAWFWCQIIGLPAVGAPLLVCAAQTHFSVSNHTERRPTTFAVQRRRLESAKAIIGDNMARSVRRVSYQAQSNGGGFRLPLRSPLARLPRPQLR
jgi:hypothetical protein